MTPALKWLLTLLVIAFLALVWTQRELLSDVDEPRHTVVKQDGPFEIRDYQSVVAAETFVGSTGRREATNTAFAPLFSYISGENTATPLRPRRFTVYIAVSAIFSWLTSARATISDVATSPTTTRPPPPGR